MKHYNFKEIREKGNCSRFATEVLGAKIVDGRCAAVWRNGTNPESVAIDAEKWFDHAANVGGGIIELCAIATFGSCDSAAIQNAQEVLGEWLNLPEVKFRKAVPAGKSRYDELIEAGYVQKAKYDYVDLNGTILYSVYRLEHKNGGPNSRIISTGKKSSFCQIMMLSESNTPKWSRRISQDMPPV